MSTDGWDIVLSDVRLTPEQKRAANEVLDSGWLSMGPRTRAFEEAFAEASGATDPVSVSNATSGLTLALAACGVGPGDEVVVPSLTFVADASAALALGADVMFADVEAADRPAVSCDDILRAVSDRTRAVIVVHYGGYQVDIEPLLPLRERGIAIIDDAAHAVGPVDGSGRWFDLSGDVAVYSFFANKNLSLGEGGMVAAQDPERSAKVRLLRSHGMTAGTWDRHKGHATDYDVVEAGWNFRPQEVAAALGEAGIADLVELNRARRRALDGYRARFGQDGPVQVVFEPGRPNTGHIAVAAMPPGCKAAVRAALTEARIQSSFHYPPIHRFTAYQDVPERPLPATEAAAEQLVTLPLHPWLSDRDLDRVVEVVLSTVRRHARP